MLYSDQPGGPTRYWEGAYVYIRILFSNPRLIIKLTFRKHLMDASRPPILCYRMISPLRAPLGISQGGLSVSGDPRGYV